MTSCTMTSNTKTVLVSYLEKKKRMVIPPEKSESDFEYLKCEFLTQFKFEQNVKLNITFQKFYTEWPNDYVDLEDTDEIEDKDKLKAVVIPILTQEMPEASACPSTNSGVS